MTPGNRMPVEFNFEFYYLDELYGVPSLGISYDIPIHYGANLVSFHALPADSSVGNIMSSLGDYVSGVIGEGLAATPNPVLGWVGRLEEFQGTKGYWIKSISEDDFSFSFNLSQSTTRRLSLTDKNNRSDYLFNQSTNQAFYFIDELDDGGLGVQKDEWILVYEDDVLVGSRQWKGPFVTDLPAMGNDGTYTTYLMAGEVPYLKVYDASNGSTLDVTPGSALPGAALSGTFAVTGTSTACNGGNVVDE